MYGYDVYGLRSSFEKNKLVQGGLHKEPPFNEKIISREKSS